MKYKDKTFLRDYDFPRRGRIMKLSQREIQRRIGVSRKTIRKIYNNHPGIGGLIDLELKKLISNRISLYSRIGGDIIHFDGGILGNPFAVNKIASLNYTMGIKIKLTNDFACP